jgi:hypothetical protein
MADLKAELSDSDLMEKYGISFQGLQDLFTKLIQAGLATQAYFDKRSTKQVGARKETTVRTCPYCGYSSLDQFKECPRCHQDISDWLDTMELTKMLTSPFE